MIEFIKSFATSSGAVFKTIEEAQREELRLTLTTDEFIPAKGLFDILLERREQIVDILTMTPTSKPKARAIHGGRKPRKKESAPPSNENTKS